MKKISKVNIGIIGVVSVVFGIMIYYFYGRTEYKMVYEYQQKNFSTLNFDLDDLDFKVNEVEKISEITARDSLNILKKELGTYYSSDITKSELDTLSFEYIKREYLDLIESYGSFSMRYQNLVQSAIRYGDHSAKRAYIKKRDEFHDKEINLRYVLMEVEKLEKNYNRYLENPDEVLTVKYKVKFSVRNPMLNNALQVFTKYMYTNSEQTKFVVIEDVENV